jgi:DUF4097 and DUF4098 domain-containing protein YvlB
MKTRLIVALAGALTTLPAIAETEIDRTLDAAPDGTVEISNVAGSIEIRGWSRDAVEVKGTLGDDVEELVFERDDDYVLIKVKVPRHHGRDIDSELLIKVPERSSIEVSGVSADIDVGDVLGEQSLQTVSGDIETRSARADVEAGSVSGDVLVIGGKEDADTEAGTVSGDVTLENLAGAVEAASVSGDVIVKGGSFDSAELETVNGDLEFLAELRRGGELSMESVNGTIDVEFVGEVSARFDIETFNGSIRNCFGPKPERTSKYSPGLELSFRQGDGDGRVAIETLNGSVRICNQ